MKRINTGWLMFTALLVGCGSTEQKPSLEALGKQAQAAINAGIRADLQLPSNVRVEKVVVEPSVTTLYFTAETALNQAVRQEALEQAFKVLPGLLSGKVKNLEVRSLFGGRDAAKINGSLQAQAFECPGATRFEGGNVREKPTSVTGARVMLNPGHGYYRTDNGSFKYQREPVNVNATPPVYAQEDQSNLFMALSVADKLSASGMVTEAARSLNLNAGIGITGKAKWEEAAIHALPDKGLPEGVWNSEGNSWAGNCAIGRDIRARAFAANYWGADAIVGLHSNAYSDTSVRGTRIFYTKTPFLPDTPGSTPANSQALALAIASHIRDSIRAARPDLNWPEPIIAGSDEYGEIGYAKMPGVLIEVGFHTNATDGQALNESSFREAVAAGVHDALNEFFGPPQAQNATWDAPADVTLSSGIVGGTANGFLALKNVGADSSFQITTSPSALTVTPASGSLAAGTTTNLTLTGTCPLAGTQTGTLSVSGGNSTKTVNVRWACLDSTEALATPQPPAVTMSSLGRIQLTWPEVTGAQVYTFKATFDGADILVQGEAKASTSRFNSAVAQFASTPEAPDKLGKQVCFAVKAQSGQQQSNYSSLVCTTYRYYKSGIIISPQANAAQNALLLVR